jgi:hypothetical protein
VRAIIEGGIRKVHEVRKEKKMGYLDVGRRGLGVEEWEQSLST